MDDRRLSDKIEAIREVMDLTDVSDSALRTVGVALAELVQRLEGNDDQAWELARTLWLVCGYELSHREEAEHFARVAVDANGHEVWVSEQTGSRPGWWAYCSCLEATDADRGSLVPLCETREEAVEAAGVHAVKHDGKWATWTD